MIELLKLDGLEPETINRFYPFLTDIDKEQIQVLKVLQDTRAAYEDFYVFENAVLVLNEVSPNITEMEGSTPEFIWRTLDIIFTLHPKLELSWEVLGYIKYIFNDNGYYFYHPKLQLENPHYEAVKQLAENGPFPVKEDFIGIQAIKYLKIKSYLENGG